MGDHYRETRAVFERTARLMDGFYDADAGGPREHTPWQLAARSLVHRQALDVAAAAPLRLGDLGCGRADLGRELLTALPAGSSLTGFDFSPRTLAVARRVCAGLRARFALADLRRLPAGDACLDLILLVNALHHAQPDDQVRVLREAARVTRSTLIVELKNGAHPYHRLVHPGVVLDGVRIYPTRLGVVTRTLRAEGLLPVRHGGIWGPSWASPIIVARFDRPPSAARRAS